MHQKPLILRELKEKIKKNNLILKLNDILHKKYNLDLTFGAEIEFYSNDKISQFVPNIIKERGKLQYEVHSKIHESPIEFIEELDLIKKHLLNISKQNKLEIDLSPKPYPNDYGSSMQIQFSSDNELFQKNIGNICSFMCEVSNEIFLIFASSEDEYQRFDCNFMAPTKVSFGINNRSCLYRITGSKPNQRIEIRASSNYSYPELIISFICISILESLGDKKKRKFEMTYGNSFDTQYNLPSIPKNMKEAEKIFKTDIYEKYF